MHQRNQYINSGQGSTTLEKSWLKTVLENHCAFLPMYLKTTMAQKVRNSPIIIGWWPTSARQQRLKQKGIIIVLYLAVLPAIATDGFMSRLLQIPWSGFGKVTNLINFFRLVLVACPTHWNSVRFIENKGETVVGFWFSQRTQWYSSETWRHLTLKAWALNCDYRYSSPCLLLFLPLKHLILRHRH